MADERAPRATEQRKTESARLSVPFCRNDCVRRYFVVVVVVVLLASVDVDVEPAGVVVVVDADGEVGVVVVVVDEVVDGGVVAGGVTTTVELGVDEVAGGVFTTGGLVTTVGRSHAERAMAASVLARSIVYFIWVLSMETELSQRPRG
jgi:hypothetical protein